jgi:hypothetical protein
MENNEDTETDQADMDQDKEPTIHPFGYAIGN